MNKQELIDFGFFIAMYPFYDSGHQNEVIPTAQWMVRLLDKENNTYDPDKIFELYEEFKKDYYE